MASRFFDENTAAKYRKLEFSFENASLRDKVIALAGGTGGLGAATAALLVQHRARVVAGYQGDTGRAQQMQAALKAYGEGEVTPCQADITTTVGRGQLLDAGRR